MKKDTIQFQAALFGDFAAIQPNAETIRYFMEEFSDLQLIPSVLEQPEPKERSGFTLRIGPDIRFLFRSDDGRWVVNFGNTRIDVLNVKKSPESPDLDNSEMFISLCLKLFGPIDARFVGDYSRLSFIARHFILEATEQDIRGFFKERFIAGSFYSENIPKEWQFRLVSRKPFDFKDDEEVNVVTQMMTKDVTMNRESGIETFEGIECSFDINTAQEKSENRFTLGHFESFLGEAATLEQKLQSEVLNYAEYK